MSEQVLQTLQGVVSEAVEERRGLVVYSRLQPVEMDRLARQLERDTLEKIQHLLPEKAADERVLGVQRRLERMRVELTELDDQSVTRETSRRMQSDEIVWQAFEDIAKLLGVG